MTGQQSGSTNQGLESRTPLVYSQKADRGRPRLLALMFWELAERKEKARRPESDEPTDVVDYKRGEDVSQTRRKIEERDSSARTAAVVQRASCKGDNNSAVGSSLREALAESREVMCGTALLPRQGKQQHPPFMRKTQTASLL